MKILILSNADSVHTKRWVKSLIDKNIDVVLYSIIPGTDDFYEKNNVKHYFFDLFTYRKKGILSVFKKYHRHFKAVSDLKRVINKEKPDILNAHYATSFGLVAALSNFHPFVISVWGSDVYQFPNQSFMNRKMFQFIMKKADKICSTSSIMSK